MTVSVCTHEYTQYHMESASYGIYALVVLVSEIERKIPYTRTFHEVFSIL